MELINNINNFFKNRKDIDETDVILDLRTDLGDGLMMFKDQSLGFMIELDAFYDEPLTEFEYESKLKEYYKLVQGVAIELKGAGIETVVQVIYRQTAEKRSEYDHSYDNESEIAKILRDERIESIKQVRVLKKKVYISFRTADHVKLTKRDTYLEKISTIKEVITTLHQRGFEGSLRVMPSASEYLEVISGFLNKERQEVIIDNFDLSRSLPLCRYKRKDSVLEINQEEFQVLTMENTKRPIALGGGSMRMFLENIPHDDFIAVMTISSIEKELTTDLHAKMGWVGRRPFLRDILAEFESFKSNIDSTRPFGSVSLSIVLKNGTKNLYREIDNLGSDLLCSKFRMEKTLAYHVLKNSLPLNAKYGANEIPNRYKVMRLENAMMFAPIYGGPRNSEIIEKRVSRNGCITSFDLFKGEGNKMTCVLGMTRAGKSVEINKIICEFMARNPDGVVRVIDKRTSYKKLTELCEGKIIEYNEDSLKEMPANPFAIQDPTLDDIESIYSLVKTTIIQTNNGIKFEAIHGELLKESIKLAFNIFKRGKDNKFTDANNVTFEDVKSVMASIEENMKGKQVKDVDKAKADLVKWSLALQKGGVYGHIFSSEERGQLGSSENIVVYDLEGINDPIMRQVAAMMAFIKCMRDIRNLPKTAKKLIIFEELGMLLIGKDESQKVIEEFVMNVVKTCAKLGTQAIAITNNVQDYTDTLGGRAFWDNAAIRLFLPVGAMSSTIQEKWGKQLTEADLQIISSLRINRSLRVSQAYYMLDTAEERYKGSILIPLSRLMDALTTTSASQVALYEDYRKEGLTPREAMEKMARECPYGEKL